MFLHLLSSKRATPTLNNPSFDLNSPSAWDYLASGPSSAGVSVTAETALGYAPMWRGVNIIAGDVGKLTIYIYKRKGEGKERDPAHPAYRLLATEPSTEMFLTADVFKQTLQAHALLHGNGYAYIFRSKGGIPLELLPLNPHTTYPVRENGRLWYVTQVNGQDRKLDPADVLHIKGLGFDGLTGYDVITYAKETLGRGMAAGKFASKYFQSSARPSVVIEHPKQLSQPAAQRLRESWDTMHAGIENSHKTAVLEEGMKLNAFSSNAKDAQLLELRQFEIRDVANILGVPPHMLGDTTRTAFASLEQENQSYLDRSLDPWLVKWESECRSKLLTEREKAADSHVVEFLRLALMRVDAAARGEFYNKATAGHPWMTVNEVRGRENMNPIEGFDEIVPPTNNFGPEEPAPEPEAGPVAEPDKPDDEAERADARRRLRLEVFARITKRAGQIVRKAAKKPGEFGEFLEGIGEFDVWAREAAGLTLEVCGKDSTACLARWRDELRAAWDHAYSSNTPAQFEAAIESVTKRLELELPAMAADWE